MLENDTVSLLRECNSGTQMAVYSIDEILENIKNEKFREILISSKDAHERLGSEIHLLSQKYGDTTKEPTAFAKGMSWLKTNARLALEDSDRVCADLITNGCNMGIKTLCRFQNEYAAADEQAQTLCRELIRIEENLLNDTRPFL